MRPMMVVSFALTVTLMLGCQQERATAESASQEEVQTPAARDLTPEQMGELGARIERQPEKADELLAQHGLDRAGFEARVRQITEDPEASKRYAAAYRSAGA